VVWICGLTTLTVGAVVALAELDDAWALALACVTLVASTSAIPLVLGDALAHEEDEPRRVPRMRRGAAGLAVSAAIALVLAVALTVKSDDETATATAPAGTAESVQTVRDFLTAAFVRFDGESACGYLTPTEQQRVSAEIGDGTTCREMFDGSAAAGAAAVPTTTKQVRDLRVRTTALSRGVRVTTGQGITARSFVLVPATAAESQAFNAPASAWRIASGATTVIGG
jgi:hypothetical protein